MGKTPSGEVVLHRPVLLKESVELLAVKPDGVYADLTLGLGGHAGEILRLLGRGGRLIGVDKDGDALVAARERLSGLPGRLDTIRSDFRYASGRIRALGVDAIDGFLMDLGVSMMQLKTPERGFGFMEDAPLDMRMDTSGGPNAAELVNTVSEAELASIIKRYGEERWAAAIARKIVERRAVSRIDTTAKLAKAVMDAVPRKAWPKNTHPATRTFQAVRIAVNDELAALAEGLDGMLEMLSQGGRAVVISYHSLEDRIVKQVFKSWARGCTCPPDFPRCVCGRLPRLKVLTGRPVTPAEEEIRDNPSARSAKLRAAERIA